MKIQLDTESKTIRIENDVLLSKLVETLNKILPNGEWKKFTLQTHTVIQHWHDPIIIEKYVQPYIPYKPWQPWYMLSSSQQLGKMTAEYKAENKNFAEAKLSLKSGTYNIEA